ncbi:hypothetical protein B0H11DRAFT_1912942 [Mycena galericulata]|nr:hypothetical protein B0H11DRAFT_1912942 [Mycena galericulata]
MASAWDTRNILRWTKTFGSPTFVGAIVKTPEDAHSILIAAWMGAIRFLKHPLRINEQRQIRSGDVFIWQTRTASTTSRGLERFRDGHQWGPSRRRGDFLHYEEDVGPQHCTRAIVRSTDAHLMKKVYGAWILCLGGDRKWHVALYYVQDDAARLIPVSMPAYKAFAVPAEVMRCTMVHEKSRNIRMLIQRPGISRLPLPVLEQNADTQTLPSLHGVVYLGTTSGLPLHSLFAVDCMSGCAAVAPATKVDTVGREAVPDGRQNTFELEYAPSVSFQIVEAECLAFADRTGSINPMWLCHADNVSS